MAQKQLLSSRNREPSHLGIILLKIIPLKVIPLGIILLKIIHPT